ncbi:MAG: class I SAM-dependent methyltransferase [Chthonomonadaceae bacterium]|nr:class I SAM-dependent methyltransferase [Chthonomonadaceae bacterium]
MRDPNSETSNFGNSFNAEDRRTITEPQTDWRVWQDGAVATQFVKERRGAILGGATQLEVMLELLPPRPPNLAPTWVLDLGCGDGVLLETILRHWTGANGVALDGSPTMLELALERLSIFHPSAVSFISEDINLPKWKDALPVLQFDAIVSGFCIHHLEDERKKALYAEIYDLLAPGGVFINIEHVASVTPHGEELFSRAYVRNIVRRKIERGEEGIFEDELTHFVNRLDASANRLTSVETQLQWLCTLGYTDVDCYWKHYELAVFAGYKKN